MLETEKISPEFTFRPLRGRAIWALFMIATFIVISLVGVGSSLAQYDLLQRIAVGELVTEAEIVGNDSRQMAIGGIYFAAFVGVVISFLIWINRASKNLTPLGIVERRFSPGEAVGWWFCPIANLWIPFQVMTEIWCGSHPLHARTSPLLWIWWIIWLIANLAGYIPTVASCNISDSTSIGDLMGISAVLAGFYAIVAVAGILLFILVWRITANQRNKYATTPSMAVNGVSEC